RAKRVVWSGWVSVLASTRLDVWIADAPPCSVDDLAGVAVGEKTGVLVPKGIACPSWLAAAPGDGGAVRVALCQRDECGSMTTWRTAVLATSQPRTDEPKKAFPAWLTWTAAGIGAAAATSLILWQTGAFDRTTAAPKVVYDGSHL